MPSSVRTDNLRSTYLGAPAAPPGFTADVVFAKDKVLNPKGFFLQLIDMVYVFGVIKPWHDFVDGSLGFNENKVYLAVRPHAKKLLKISHVVLGINQIAMAAVQEQLFYQSFTKLSIHGTQASLPLGEIIIRQSRLSLQEDQDIEHATAWNLTANDFPNSGTLLALEKAGIKIAYEFYGRKINSKDMFTAVMDGRLYILIRFSPSYCSGTHRRRQQRGTIRPRTIS